ncbi:hypothetical protein [Tumebacillus permanentifrigoris]|uniref:Uncharacterized protein n=1 Tax=Tumebacillus permanentifrigoris TaxID=378543 RepID=A0A316D2U0_9BACL|nr:hypothetical protein [Tumebacillus permanentifrigoris]PWK05267.1 hypothetical protein C7459_12416 [Tumebacillus permanentifrigoris]
MMIDLKRCDEITCRFNAGQVTKQDLDYVREIWGEIKVVAVAVVATFREACRIFAETLSLCLSVEIPEPAEACLPLICDPDPAPQWGTFQLWEVFRYRPPTNPVLIDNKEFAIASTVFDEWVCKRAR